MIHAGQCRNDGIVIFGIPLTARYRVACKVCGCQLFPGDERRFAGERVYCISCADAAEIFNTEPITEPPSIYNRMG